MGVDHASATAGEGKDLVGLRNRSPNRKLLILHSGFILYGYLGHEQEESHATSSGNRFGHDQLGGRRSGGRRAGGHTQRRGIQGNSLGGGLLQDRRDPGGR